MEEKTESPDINLPELPDECFSSNESPSQDAQQNPKFKNKKTIVIAALACVVLIALVSFFGYQARQTSILKEQQIKTDRYAKAIDLYESGEYEQAATLFDQMPDFKDSKELSEKSHIASKVVNSKAWKDIKLALNTSVESSLKRGSISFDPEKDEIVITHPSDAEPIDAKIRNLRAQGKYMEARYREDDYARHVVTLDESMKKMIGTILKMINSDPDLKNLDLSVRYSLLDTYNNPMLEYVNGYLVGGYGKDYIHPEQ